MKVQVVIIEGDTINLFHGVSELIKSNWIPVGNSETVFINDQRHSLQVMVRPDSGEKIKVGFNVLGSVMRRAKDA